jgi:hypothetical protein
MGEAYLRVERDFDALTGETSARTLAELARVVEEAERTRGEAAAGAIPGLWMEEGLLGPEVAVRLAARRAEAAAKARAGGRTATAAEVLAAAARLVFPEATMADNWDRHFLDLDVVRRWVKAKEGSAPPPPSAPPPDGDAPGPEGEGAAPPPAIPDPSDMVPVPKGELAVPEHRGRGWPDPNQRAERRAVRGFYIDRTEVTCGAYAAFLRGLRDTRLRDRLLPTGWKVDEKGEIPLPPAQVLLPVSGVPYEGAAAFAASLGKRLPTEDEWERAARGDGDLRYPGGNDWVDGRAVVGGRPAPVPVGTTPGDVSPYGVLDLCGNLSEFCASHPDGKPVKGIPKATDQVVLRGGNFRDSPDEAAHDWRYVIGGTSRSEKVGFRCAMDERDFDRRYGRK